MAWAITSYSKVGNTATVNAANSANGDTMQLVVTSDPIQPTYTASFHYEHPLTPAEVATLNGKMITNVRSKYTALGLTPPPLLTSPVSVVMDFSNIDCAAPCRSGRSPLSARQEGFPEAP